MTANVNRRDLLIASGLALLGTTQSFAQQAATPQQPAPQDRLLAALRSNRRPLVMGDTPSGSGWDWLVQEARSARFTLIGEEHGVAETAQLSAALFNAIRPAGYSRVAIELSPPIAEAIESAARRGGFRAIQELLASPDIWTFYHMKEEIQFVADVVKGAPGGERVLWGLDREIFSDRYLISRLEAKAPASAKAAVLKLRQASASALATWERTKNPDDLFILSGEPVLVPNVRAAWPTPDHESDTIFRTLEESLAIETAERSGGLWPYMQRRLQWNRENLAALLRDGQSKKVPPKVLLKFGYNHMIRGTNYMNGFDMGAMADEVAALTRERAFHVLVIPGTASQQAVPGPNRTFVAAQSDQMDELRAGDQRITRVLPNPSATGHEVIDLRALRPLAMRGLESWNADVVRTIQGFDAAVIWKGAHPSSTLGA